MNVFQITIQRKLGDSWPVVVERIRASELPLRAEGKLDLVACRRKQLLKLDLDPLARARSGREPDRAGHGPGAPAASRTADRRRQPRPTGRAGPDAEGCAAG